MSKPDWAEAPDDATHWDALGGCFCNEQGWWLDEKYITANQLDWGDSHYTPRPVEPATTAWDGTGLPPVGMECEMVIGAQKPRTVCFVGIKSSGSVVIETVDGEFKSYHRSQVNFRPIPTQAQIDRALLTETLNCMRKETDMGVIADSILELGFRITKP